MTGPDPVIRDARPDDAPVLTSIVRQSGAYDGEYRAVVVTQLVDAAYLAANPTRVCVDGDGEILGFASLLLPGRGVPGEAELDFMFVSDASQRRGVGRRLIADLVERCRELGVNRVHIVSHPPAAAFYESVGAVPVGEIPPRGRVTWSRPLLRLDIE